MFGISHYARPCEDDLALSLVPITFDDLTNRANKIFRTSLVPLDLPGGYDANLAGCNGQPVSVGDQIPISLTAPSVVDFSNLVALDPTAAWNDGTKTIDSSCAALRSCVPPNSLSPRLVAIAVFDVDIF